MFIMNMQKNRKKEIITRHQLKVWCLFTRLRRALEMDGKKKRADNVIVRRAHVY